MKKYVDVDVLKQQDFQDFSNTDVLTAIDGCPAADVAPVVRCKDCVYYRQTEDWDRRKYKACHLLAHIIIHKTKPEDFCSFGEKAAGGVEDG